MTTVLYKQSTKKTPTEDGATPDQWWGLLRRARNFCHFHSWSLTIAAAAVHFPAWGLKTFLSIVESIQYNSLPWDDIIDLNDHVCRRRQALSEGGSGGGEPDGSGGGESMGRGGGESCKAWQWTRCILILMLYPIWRGDRAQYVLAVVLIKILYHQRILLYSEPSWSLMNEKQCNIIHTRWSNPRSVMPCQKLLPLPQLEPGNRRSCSTVHWPAGGLKKFFQMYCNLKLQ